MVGLLHLVIRRLSSDTPAKRPESLPHLEQKIEQYDEVCADLDLLLLNLELQPMTKGLKSRN